MKKILLLGMLLCGMSDVWGTVTAGGQPLSAVNVALDDVDNTIAIITGEVAVSRTTIAANALLNEIKAIDGRDTAETVQIVGNFTMTSSLISELENINLDEITSITGDVRIYENTSLTAFSMAGLETIGGDLFFYDNNTITVDGAFPSLNSIFGQDWEYGTLGVFSKEEVAGINEVRIYSFGITSFDAAGLGNYTEEGVISGSLYIMPSSTLTTIDPNTFNALTTVGSFYAYSISELTTLSLPVLTTVEDGGFSAYSNTSMTTLSLPVLTTVGGGFDVNQNDNLTELFVPSLITVEGDFNIRDDNELTELSAPNLRNVESVAVSRNSLLVIISLPTLATTLSDCNVNENDKLTELSLPVLTTVGGHFGLQGHPLLTTISLPVLTTVGGDFYINENPELTTLTLQPLVTVGQDFYIGDTGAFTKIPWTLFDGVVRNVNYKTGDVYAGFIDTLSNVTDKAYLLADEDGEIPAEEMRAILQRNPQITVNVPGAPRTLHTHINTNYSNGDGTYSQRKYALL
ncbi:hypothetical protein K9K77_00470 [Candidatus Babeliales bacterium]|nr:hypothetical protein [Candidatus Babeliales bacterium]